MKLKKETFYFSHDYTARSDEKIKNLIYDFGYEGYGIYWSLIEELYQNNLEIEGERIRYFYLNPEHNAFNYKDLKTDLVFNDAGIKGQTLDGYLPLYFANKISSLKGIHES